MKYLMLALPLIWACSEHSTSDKNKQAVANTVSEYVKVSFFNGKVSCLIPKNWKVSQENGVYTVRKSCSDTVNYCDNFTVHHSVGVTDKEFLYKIFDTLATKYDSINYSGEHSGTLKNIAYLAVDHALCNKSNPQMNINSTMIFYRRKGIEKNFVVFSFLASNYPSGSYWKRSDEFINITKHFAMNF